MQGPDWQRCTLRSLLAGESIDDLKYSTVLVIDLLVSFWDKDDERPDGGWVWLALVTGLPVVDEEESDAADDEEEDDEDDAAGGDSDDATGGADDPATNHPAQRNLSASSELGGGKSKPSVLLSSECRAIGPWPSFLTFRSANGRCMRSSVWVMISNDGISFSP